MHVCEIDWLLYTEENILPEAKDVLNHLVCLLLDIYFYFKHMHDFLVDSLDDQSHVAFETLGVGWLALAVDSFAEEYTFLSACLIDAQLSCLFIFRAVDLRVLYWPEPILDECFLHKNSILGVLIHFCLISR